MHSSQSVSKTQSRLGAFMPMLAIALAVACVSFDALLSTAHSEIHRAHLERGALGP